MYYLEHIQLGNIRRFAADVSIPVSRGATIFLAPNGTGKTSLFEGIECCLTGEVGRLVRNAHDALIRDGALEAFTELRFSDNLTCRGTVRAGHQPQVSGDHDRLFPDIDLKNLPYLLRLTHLLPQRGVEWLVQSGSEDAGSLLNKLPIGRDAMRASNNIQKIKRGFTGLIREAELELETITAKIQDWTRLLAQKSNVTQSLQGELLPLDNITLQANTFSNRFQQLSPVAGGEIPLLKARLAELLQLVALELGEERQRFDRIASLESVPGSFITLVEQLKLNEGQLRVQQAAVIEANKNYLESKQTADNISTKLGAERVALVLIRQRAQMALELEKTQSDLLKNTTSLQAAKDALDQFQMKLVSDQQKHQAELSVRQSHQRNTLAREALLTEQNKIAADNTAINRWRTLLEQASAASNRRDTLKTEMRVLNERKTILDQELQSRQRIYNNAMTQRDALMTATDAIKTAVANIVSLLPVDSSVCPVCLAEYEPAILKAKMEESLRRIQPGLDEANGVLMSAKQAFDEATSSKTQNQIAIDNAENALAEIENVIQSLSSDITELQIRFEGITAVEEAVTVVMKRNEENKMALQQNSEEKAVLPDQMPPTDWSLLLEALDQTKTQITEAEIRIQDSTSMLLQLTSRIEELNRALTNMNSVEPNLSIEEQEQIIRNSEVLLEEATRLLDNKGRAFTQAEEMASRLTRQRGEISQQIESLKARWTGVGLDADPVAVLWDRAKNDVAAAIRRIETELAGIQRLQTELTKWSVVEDISRIDSDIDAARGDLTISDFSEKLSANLRDTQAKVDTIKERSRAFNNFGEKLRIKLEQLQEYLLAINEPWRELLHRVVLDPRFTETTLNAYTKNNKQHAEVKVPLHGSHIPANFIASEAQITDLQFTFLLAMALNNQWAPWKGLLLDDPTQHHDLVHASSVFDLLRDYIVDHNYQVLLATHDSVHAKFFLRKLQNDGIPTNLIYLRSEQEGVIAELITD